MLPLINGSGTRKPVWDVEQSFFSVSLRVTVLVVDVVFGLCKSICIVIPLILLRKLYAYYLYQLLYGLRFLFVYRRGILILGD